MKKEFNKIVLFVGFLTALVGIWVSVFTSLVFQGLSITALAVILSFAFVNSTNKALKTVGYSISAVLGAIGTNVILTMFIEEAIDIGAFIFAVGMVIMAFAALVYLFVFVLNYFGFVKNGQKEASKESACLCNELIRFKEMKEDGILTADEFSDLKQKAMDGAETTTSSMDDLKKWKKLLDQQVITEEEFASIKKNIFAK